MNEFSETKTKRIVLSYLKENISRLNNETVQQYNNRLIDLTNGIWEIIVQTTVRTV